LTRPSTQRQRHLRAISDLGNIINYLTAGIVFSVDGRIKPGHDGKPKVGRYGATSNGQRYKSRQFIAEN
jgi:hypothetical protein